MDYEEIGEVADAPVRVPTSDDYRTCSVCGDNCEPNPDFSSDDAGVRIAFICPHHGIQSLMDPFESMR